MPKPRYPANPDAPAFMPHVWNEGHSSALDGVALSNCIQYAYAGSSPDGTNQVYDEAIPQLGYTGGHLILYDVFAVRSKSGVVSWDLKKC